ncbi:nitrate reductase subunit alpha [Saccharopolyspora spinosa]|uniref:Nitrate reductase alpha subunit n=1 Tax=Saccharopolyspora spinosa TaxID=60894 RepID=A0A2N3XUY1_SACSN|nr:nitrate reductase subunit alpha [Saccharopolyspora spinosa]PKW14477.1 respiratory nitrate reductase alpha subunit apoprotein [Saccharopolyspora spinosa]
MANRPEAGTDGPVSDLLLRTRKLLSPGKVSADLRSIDFVGGREGDVFYRDRWSHDKVVRSTHGVNCTGSCSWQVYVKDGIITWEAQQTDYPSAGPDSPEYEPRGCPRGAAFSWYTYSPTRLRYPYVRGVLLELYRRAKAATGDPVLAWQSIVDDPEARRSYQRARGKGGLVRADWDEVVELIAAAHVHTIRRHGPDRIAGFSPIPAMSMVSHAAGARFMSLIGGTMLSFYDWYADLPVASPQVFGDQTDVPESADWWNSSYLVMWGSNVPVTRTPDAHFMTEARYRGQKVVVVSPDYADNVKFADTWMSPQPGTDGALAMAIGHVILRDFFVQRQAPRFADYVRRYTDLPFLVGLRDTGGRLVPDKFLTAADLGAPGDHDRFKPVLVDERTGREHVPGGSLGFRFNSAETGRWNLDLGEVQPQLSLLGHAAAERVAVELPRFDVPGERGARLRRGVPAIRVGGRLVTTVFDLVLANYGVARAGLPGDWPSGPDDPKPHTPAWQEEITGVPAAQVTRVAREFARNAEESGGRSMILMGAGTNHWFHSDTIYRAFLALVTLTGCQGINGGGWAHYVGQEKCRPATGWAQLAGALDWSRPPRQMIGTAFWYLATDQWRYDALGADELIHPLGPGRLWGAAMADCIARSARMGWMPSYPTFDRNPLELVDSARAAGVEPADHVIDELRAGRLHFACTDPDAEQNWPRIVTVWRANLLGSSAKGNEYFLKHLLGTDSALMAEEAPPNRRPQDVRWLPLAPEGKLDLLVSLDFRMTSTGLCSDVLLPAATWYEKHDLSSTDMHPFVHAFTPAIAPPWQTRSDFAAFHAVARKFSELAAIHLGIREDLVAAPLLHDTPDELATPGGVVRDWGRDEVEPIPGVTMPKLIVVRRDYPAVAEKMAALGPLVDRLGVSNKGWTVIPDQEVERLRHTNGTVQHGVATGRPSLARDVHACEAILALSGTTNGRIAVAGFRTLEERTGVRLADLALDNEGKQVTFADTQSRPVPVITSPEWSGSEHGGRRYTAFAINVERLKPWHTLTGRQHFYLDHDWMQELGEGLPVYRPPLNMHQLFGEPEDPGSTAVSVRYLTPHSKWSIHSEYQDNLLMLALSRGGPDLWMSPADAERIGVRDNDWVEAVNRNGVVVARAVVSQKMPRGTVYMYHAKDRTVDVPKSEISGLRGGIHNSLTRLLLKPTHLIGGYAQLAFAFNYLGPTGNQRDEVTVIRRRSQEVEY